MPDINLPPTIPDASPATYPELPPEPKGSWLASNRKSAILVVIAVLLASAVGVTTLLKKPARQSNTNITNESTVNSVAVTNTSTPNTNRTTFRRYQATTTPDQDHDGLSDKEEQQAGTKLDAADSDSDGLSDYDEVKVYQSNPKKQDSDGDGKTDRQEVVAGTNPNGDGPLLNTSQAIQQLNNTNQ